MNKLISILLALTVALSLTAISAHADEPAIAEADPTEPTEVYVTNPVEGSSDVTNEPDADVIRHIEKLCEQYRFRPELDMYDPDNYSEYLSYFELYTHHYGTPEKPYMYDWILVQSVYRGCYCCALLDGIIGGRALTASCLPIRPFLFTFGIYDAELDRFFDLAEVDFDDYDGLYEVWRDLDIYTSDEGTVRLGARVYPGDADGDGEISILDATVIQRMLAGLCSKYEIAVTSADTDKDGDVTVLDATCIQRYEAGMCGIDGSPLSSSEDKHYRADS